MFSRYPCIKFISTVNYAAFDLIAHDLSAHPHTLCISLCFILARVASALKTKLRNEFLI